MPRQREIVEEFERDQGKPAGIRFLGWGYTAKPSRVRDPFDGATPRGLRGCGCGD